MIAEVDMSKIGIGWLDLMNEEIRREFGFPFRKLIGASVVEDVGVIGSLQSRVRAEDMPAFVSEDIDGELGTGEDIRADLDRPVPLGGHCVSVRIVIEDHRGGNDPDPLGREKGLEFGEECGSVGEIGRSAAVVILANVLPEDPVTIVFMRSLENGEDHSRGFDGFGFCHSEPIQKGEINYAIVRCFVCHVVD